ncbi:hypothetical protein J3458_022478 [Metarhizium acridum]|uniref:uncharacterized protein n=1 Tax=Metarhizium acridum TaxID=92637 RepID=UPI001C6B3761|nr:hypothetical protein J3458_022478 [Metarhizium acridum]
MSSETGSPPLLDHLVVLVSHATLLQLPSRLQHLLVIAPGGTHADGATTNKLILFEDGFYIELIAFLDGVDPELRNKHRWGREKENTVIDWAYTLGHEQQFEAVRERVRRAGAPILYTHPVPGGRTREDGVVLKWAVAVAQHDEDGAVQPGKLPFWCLDRTPRNLRVPYDESPLQTRHPCGARGISTIRVKVPAAELKALGQVYDAIHDAEQSAYSWTFDVPSPTSTATHSVSLVGSDEFAIDIALWGSPGSPRTIELLPGVNFEIHQ